MSNPQKPSRMQGLFVKALGAFLLANVLLIYLPMSAVSLAVIGFVGAASMLVDFRKTLSLGISLVLVTLLFEAVVRMDSVSVTPYFRPHEMLALETSYEPNRQVSMTVPHGDLLAIDPTLPKSLAISRQETFTTDSFGYRNDTSYHDEPLILVGDSFIVGTETTLGGQLRDRYDLDTYSVGFSGMGPLIYTEKIQWARRTLSAESCLALFYFEGNDFQVVDPAELAMRDATPRRLQQVVKRYVQAVRGNSEWARVFYGLVTRSWELMSQRANASADAQDSTPATIIKTVRGKPMVFLRGYADVVHRPSFDDYGFIKGRLNLAKPDVVFFIPDKYRVYSGLLDDGPEVDLPHAQWTYLKQATDEFGIQAVDLTPHLVDHSRRLLESGDTTFWPDDTHWNGFGENVAARVILESLGSSEVPTCRAVSTRHALPGMAVAGGSPAGAGQ